MLFSYQIREVAEKLYSDRDGTPVSSVDVENYIKYNCPMLKDISWIDVSNIVREYGEIADRKRSQASASSSYSRNNEETTNNTRGGDYYDEDSFLHSYSAPVNPRKAYSSTKLKRGYIIQEDKIRYYRTCVLQVLVVIASVCTLVYFGSAFFNKDLYNEIAEVSHYFPPIIVGEVFLHRVLAKRLYYKWCTELNIWTVAAIFVLYHFYLVATLRPSSSLEEVGQAIILGEVLNFFLCRELPDYDEPFIYGIYVISAVVYLCLPTVSSFCHEGDIFCAIFRGLVFVVLIAFFVTACILTGMFCDRCGKNVEQIGSFFDSRCKTTEFVTLK